jgi:citrate lyase synthetase
MTTYRNTNAQTLSALAATLRARGHYVSDVVIPNNPFTGGNPYITTNASCRDISAALRV